MYQLLRINGNFEEELKQAMKRYRPFISREKVLLVEHSQALQGVTLIESDDESAFRLSPTHSTIIDTIANHLQTTSKKWLSFVAASLRRMTVDSSNEILAEKSVQPYVASLLLKWGIADTQGKAQDGIVNTFLHPKYRYCSNASQLMFVWNFLPQKYKKQIWQYGKDHLDIYFLRACYLLNFLDIPQKDVWEFLRILSLDQEMGGGILPFFGHPWIYLPAHLKEIPEDLRNTLDKKALEYPCIFVRALSGVFVQNWEKLPKNWQNVFLEPKVLLDDRTRGRFFSDITEHWHNIPQELKDLFYAQVGHQNPKIRKSIATWALINYEKAPDEMKPIYMATLQDSEISVPLDVMRDIGENEHDKEFAEMLYKKADKAAAADMLDSLLWQDKGESKVTWKHDLAYQCIAKGGDLAYGVLCYYYFQKHIQSEFMGYKPSVFPTDDHEPVRLAWLWSYVNSRCQRPKLTIKETKILLDSFSPDYRDLAISYLSFQINYLPQELSEYLDQLETASEIDAKSIRDGKKERQTKNSSVQRLADFPIRFFLSYDSMD